MSTTGLSIQIERPTLRRAGQVTADDEPFVVVMRSNKPLEQGARVWPTILPDRLVLFDQASGDTLAVLSSRREWCCL